MAKLPGNMPHTPEQWDDYLSKLSDEELLEIYQTEQELSQQLSVDGPKNDDELWEWIKYELGLSIPRVNVCENHDAPFKFIADVFFMRTKAALLMANRGGGKTFMVAIIHWVNSRFKPGIESLTFAAVEKQSDRAYNHLKKWIYDRDGQRKPEIVSSLMKDTTFRNGSKIEIVGSTPEQVNGPHPHVAHGDEIELMREDTWKESRNMTVAGHDRNGLELIPQDILTSTRKGPSGRMQKLIDEIEEAIEQGFDPPRDLYQYCIKETAAQRPECRRADPVLRAEKLEKLGRDPCELCNCHKIRKGKWEDGSDRTLDDICDGDFFRSEGWQPPTEIEKQFSENDRETFEVQQLCSKAELKFHYFGEFNEPHYAIRNYVPVSENGPIFLAVDWGGTNPHAVNWYQLLKYEIEVDAYTPLPDGTYPKTRLKEGTIVCFDEIYIAEIGNDKLGKMVKTREANWRKLALERGGSFRVVERFADPQGKAARIDWRDEGLVTKWHATREFDEHIKTIRSIAVDDDNFRVDVRCEMWIKEVKDWRRDENTGSQIDVFNHAMSNFRYAMQNIKVIGRKYAKKTQTPGVSKHKRRTASVTVTKSGGVAAGPVGSNQSRDDYARWRSSLGTPVSADGNPMRNR